MGGVLGLLANGSAQAAVLEGILWMVLKGTAVLAAAFAGTLCLRRCSATLRHMIWAAAFACLLVLPFWTLALPAWELGLPVTAWNRPAPSAGPTASSQVGELSAAQLGTPSQPQLNAMPAAMVAGRYPSGRLLSGPAALLALWLLAAAALLLRWAAGLWALSRTVKRSREACGPEWQMLLGRLCRRLGLSRPVALRMGGPGQMPLAWGIRRPGVLLPAEARQWDGSKKEMVLLHELAHIQRRDVLIQHLTALVSAIYWFNPLVWAASRCLRREREGACDDLVLSLGTRPSEYARQLLSLARHMRSPRFAPAPAMARPSQLEGRLLAILDPGRARSGASPRALPATSLAVLLMAAPLAALSPGFEGRPESQSAASTSAAAPAGSGETRSFASSSQATAKEGSRSGTVSQSRDGGRLEIRMQDVRFSDDYSRLVGIDDGGYLEISQRGPEGRRRLEIDPVSGGGLSRSFFVNGQRSESEAEAEELLQRALQALREVDHEHEQVQAEAEQLRREQARARGDLERSRTETEHALREAEQAAAEAQREHQAQLEEVRRRLEETLRETRSQREDEVRELERELARSRAEMEHALQESQALREKELARVHEEMERLQQELQAQTERMRRELGEERRRLQEEQERLHEVRSEMRQAVRETALQALGRTGLRDDPAAWAKLTAGAGELASQILSEASAIRVENETIRLEGDARRLSEHISRFLDRTLPEGLSGLDEALRKQVDHAVQQLSSQLADFRVER